MKPIGRAKRDIKAGETIHINIIGSTWVSSDIEFHADLDHKCSIGCPSYQSGHSIDANGNCNMGCC